MKEDAPCDLPGRHAPKERQCLRCETRFDSEWAGERICPHCKNSNAWRTGAPLSWRPNGDND
jgi:Zn finger protein HypA/HybF involved in hydrogenase expression